MEQEAAAIEHDSRHARLLGGLDELADERQPPQPGGRVGWVVVPVMSDGGFRVEIFDAATLARLESAAERAGQARTSAAEAVVAAKAELDRLLLQ